MTNIGKVDPAYWPVDVVAQLFSRKYDKWINVLAKKDEDIDAAIIRVAMSHGYSEGTTVASLVDDELLVKRKSG